MTITEFFLYLIYGYAMITMGIFAIKQKDVKVINLSLVKSLKYLGYFGIIHGISEWIIMINKLDLFPDLFIYLSNLSLISKAVSFAFLLYFGLDLLPLRDKYKRIILKVPLVCFLIYLGGFFFLFHELDYHYFTAFDISTLHYLMGFPSCVMSSLTLYVLVWLSCIISAVALYINAWRIEKTKAIKISRRYKSLAWVLIIYGFFEGILVSKADFFPANTINNELFIEYFRFTPLFIEAFVGFVIYLLLIKVIDTFRWEQEKKLSQLEKLKIASEERRKMGLEMHDSILQGLYAVGLKIEYLAINKNGDKTRNLFEEAKSDLNNTINKIREFITTSDLDKSGLEDLCNNLQQLIQKYNENEQKKINFKCEVSSYIIDNLSPEKATQIYYIIQEAVSNAVKHFQADQINVLLESRLDHLYITVIDNGKGINLKNLKIQERTQRAGGVFTIKKTKNVSRLELKIPWEGSINDGKN